MSNVSLNASRLGLALHVPVPRLDRASRSPLSLLRARPQKTQCCSFGPLMHDRHGSIRILIPRPALAERRATGYSNRPAVKRTSGHALEEQRNACDQSDT